MSNTVELTIELPPGLEATDRLLAMARRAAEAALAEVPALEAMAAELRSRGIAITVEELLDRRTGAVAPPQAGGSPPRRGPRPGSPRTRLDDSAKATILTALKAGEGASELARRHGCSLGTVMAMKRKAGLTKRR